MEERSLVNQRRRRILAISKPSRERLIVLDHMVRDLENGLPEATSAEVLNSRMKW